MPNPRPSGRSRNWKDVTFAGRAIDAVRRVRFATGAQRVTFAGDADRGPTASAVARQDPSFRVTTRARYALADLPLGGRGVFSYVHLDARNGAEPGGGAYLVTTNDQSILSDRPASDPFNDHGEQDLIINTCFIDGITNPVMMSPL